MTVGFFSKILAFEFNAKYFRDRKSVLLSTVITFISGSQSSTKNDINFEIYVFAFVDGQFDENCSNSEPCDTDKYLACTNSKCLCINTYYHKDQVCYPSKWCTDCFDHHTH